MSDYPDDVADSLKTTSPAASKSAADAGAGVTDSGQPNVDAVYREAVEFIRLGEEIKNSPEHLRTLLSRLRLACTELTTSIDSLRNQADELQGHVQSSNAVQ